MSMKTQEDFLKEILELKANNPELEITFLVSEDDMSEWAYTAQQICKVEVNLWYVNTEGRIFTDQDEINERVMEEANDLKYFTDYLSTNEELEAMFNERYKKEVKQMICVYTCA